MRRCNPLAQQFRDVDVGEPQHQHRDHESNGQYDFGFSAHGVPTAPNYSSLANAASAVALPYSLSLLCRVFKLMPRISAARVLLLLVDSSVFRMSRFSASSTVVPTPRCTVSPSSDDARKLDWPNPGGRCVVSTTGPSQTMVARSSVLRISRTLPGHE